MYIVFLKFSKNRSQAQKFMEAHMKWVKQGIEDGIFLLVGSIKPGLGGAIIAYNTNMEDLKKRVDADPFVSEGIVTMEITEIEPAKADQRLSFLLENNK